MLQSLAKKRNQAAVETSTKPDVGALIVKLRWMGMEQEADRLCHGLESESVDLHLPAEPEATD